MVVRRKKLVQEIVAGCKQIIIVENETDVALKNILDPYHCRWYFIRNYMNLLYVTTRAIILPGFSLTLHNFSQSEKHY